MIVVVFRSANPRIAWQCTTGSSGALLFVRLVRVSLRTGNGDDRAVAVAVGVVVATRLVAQRTVAHVLHGERCAASADVEVLQLALAAAVRGALLVVKEAIVPRAANRGVGYGTVIRVVDGHGDGGLPVPPLEDPVADPVQVAYVHGAAWR